MPSRGGAVPDEEKAVAIGASSVVPCVVEALAAGPAGPAADTDERGRTWFRLADGIDLAVNADKVPDREALAERMRALLDRASHVESITVDIAALVARDEFRSLELVLEAAGLHSCMSHGTSERTGRQVVALLGVFDLDDLIRVAQVAEFERARSAGPRGTG